MKRPRVLALMLMASFAGPVIAQTAVVVALSPVDTKRAKALYEERAAVDKKIAEFKGELDMRYLHAPDLVIGKDHFTRWKVGWAPGTLVFSDDFKYILPTQENWDPCSDFRVKSM